MEKRLGKEGGKRTPFQQMCYLYKTLQGKESVLTRFEDEVEQGFSGKCLQNSKSLNPQTGL